MRRVSFIAMMILTFCSTRFGGAESIGLVGHWSGDEIKEARVMDSSGRGSSGVTTGPLKVIQGVEGKAMDFTGKDDRVEVAHTDAINVGHEGQDYSVSFWFNSSVPPEAIPDAHFITKTGDKYPFSFVQNASGLIQMRTYDGKTCALVDSGLDVSDGQWHFVAGMRDGKRKRLMLYVDSLLVASGKDSTQGDLNNTGPLDIGRSMGDDFNGALDEVKVYDRLLTREEIQSQYSRPGPAARQMTGTRKHLVAKGAAGVPAMRRQMENWKPTLGADDTVRSKRNGETVNLSNAWMELTISTTTGEITALAMKEKPLLTKPGGVSITDVLTGARFAQNDGKVVNVSLSSSTLTLTKRYSDEYEATIVYTLGSQALCCEATLRTTLKEPRESRIEFNLPVLQQMTEAFWVHKNAPFALADLPTEQVVYRNFNMADTAMVLPALTVYDPVKDIGLGFIAPFDIPKPGLCFQIDTTQSRIDVCNFFLRLAKGEPARAAVYIVPHEGDWRPSLAWMLKTYPNYFRPGTPDGIETPGWYRLGGPLEGADELKSSHDAGAKWFQIHGHFPFYGIYLPETPQWDVVLGQADAGTADLGKWERGEEQGGFKNSYEKMREAIRIRQENGLQSFLYFQSFELWNQYAEKYFPDDIARGRRGAGLSAWYHCNLMNPDPAFAWGRHIAAQIKKVPEQYPTLDGIFYDRDDYKDYDYSHNDGVTMDVDVPAYMLGFAQQQINDVITGVLREHKMGIFTNGPTSVEVVKNIDGIMCETDCIAGCLQYLGLARPMTLLPYFFESQSYDTTPRQVEEKIKMALSMGYYPALTNGDAACHQVDARYKPLFALMKDREWVLTPRPLTLPDGMKGNIFRAPNGDYLVAVVNFEKSLVAGDAPTRDVPVEIDVPDAASIKSCQVLSGEGIADQELPLSREGRRIRMTIPEHMMCSVVHFKK